MKGDIINVIVRKSITSGHNADFSQVLVSLTDVTELHRAHQEKEQLENRLQQAHKMEAIGTLAGGIAHDFNNILAAIIGYVELGQLNLPPDHPSYHQLGEALKAALRAKDLVLQILTFSRKAQEERKPVNLVEMVKESIRFLRASIPATVEIRSDIEMESALVMADPTQLQQVLMNLGANALDAMNHSGGFLDISLSRVDRDPQSDDATEDPDLEAGRYFRILVSDTGQGMDKHIQNRIFEPFFTTKEKGKGTGMGLAVVHGIVKSHGGDITVTSRLGQGTSFSVFLPEAPPALADTNTPDEDRLQQPGGTEKVLFVDDEKHIAEMFRLALEKLGYQVKTFTEFLSGLGGIQIRSGRL